MSTNKESESQLFKGHRQKHQPYITHHTTLTQLEKEGHEGKKGKREGNIPGGQFPEIVELLNKGAIEKPGKSTCDQHMSKNWTIL